MGAILGALGLSDTDYAFVNTIGQSVVYDVTAQVLGDHNEDMLAVMALFVEGTTVEHTVRYKLKGDGQLQRKGSQSRAALKKATGSWDVAFPLEEFGDAIGLNRVAMAKMTIQEYDRQIGGVLEADTNTLRHEILKALITNTTRTIVDEDFPTLSVQPLANGDSVIYPPIVGAESGATSNHYLASGYVSSAISDINNPIVTIVNALEAHFGIPTAGSNIVVIGSKNDIANIKANLSSFNEVVNRFIHPGANVSFVPLDKFPAGLPGRTEGEADGALIQRWDWIPDGYLAGFHLTAPAPLKMRIDDPALGLGSGLQLIRTDMDEPIMTSEWSHRFGFGVGNRLNGVVMKLTAGSYDVPTVFTY